MKATKNRYTKEQFVKEFLLRQAKAKAENVANKNNSNNLEIVNSSLKKQKNDVININETENKKIDLTDKKEILNVKYITNDSNNKQINENKEVVEQFKKEDDIFNSENITFEIKIVYKTSDLHFNGLNLLEEKLKDGNLQVGFDVNVGVFVGDTVKKIVRKKRNKIETTAEVCAQLSFE